MDPVIRAVPLGDARTRLGSSHPAVVERPGVHIETPSRPVQAAPDAVQSQAAERAALEHLVRRELAAEAQKLFAAERQKGLAAGLEEGRRKAAEENEAALADERASRRQQFTAVQRRIDECTLTALQALSARAVDLAFESVCRIAGEHATSREFVAAIVDQQLRRHASAGPLEIRLHPEDLALLRAGENEALDSASVRWTADEAVTLGGCLIDTPMGRYDARLETQLSKLHEVFAQARPGTDHA
jgi:flagellar assembly protein FliH